MKSKAVYLLSVVLFAASLLFFLKGFFLNRVELPSKSSDSLDIYAAFNGKAPTDQSTTPINSERYLSKTVFDLGHKISTSNPNAYKSPYYSLFNANGPSTDTKITPISPITLLSTIHSMSSTTNQLFSSPSLQQLTPTKNAISSQSQPQEQQVCGWFCRQYDQIFFLVIDALRFDFLQYNHNLTSVNEPPPPITMENPPYVNRLAALAKYHVKHPTSTGFYRFRADTPTVTMQRLKAMMTGSLPTFLDVKDNFAATMIQEDNLILQVANKQHNTIMVGDDTWMGLVGPLLSRAYPYPSFDVHDLDTVDNGCIYRIHHELCGRTLTSMQLGLQQYFNQLINIIQQEKVSSSTQNLKQEINNVLQSINTFQLTFEKDTQFHQDDKIKLAQLGGKIDSFEPNVDYVKSNALPTWFIAHFLGVDHVGHRFGPRHPLMDTKLRQMNDLLKKFLDYVDISGDFTPKQDKPFFETFSTQYEFIQQYCDPTTLQPFKQHLTKVQDVLTKNQQILSQIDSTGFNTRTTARTAVYVMGDHGMTEGGNHGGASIKETQAGFAVFSTITLDSPSSYIKHQLLHETVHKHDNDNVDQKHLQDMNNLQQFGSPHSMIRTKYSSVLDIFTHLDKFNHGVTSSSTTTTTIKQSPIHTIKQHQPNLPTLALIYDFSHINNYDDVYTQTRVQTPDEEHFSMGQIDSLPTLSLITGVPIPYGNLGVLKKELVPNQFLHYHRSQLTGTYGDEWISKDMICSLFSTFDNIDEKVNIKIAELRHEIMILHLRLLNLGQMLRYANDYQTTVSTFSGVFVEDAIVHSKVIYAKLAMIEESLSILTTLCQSTSATTQLDSMANIIDTLYLSIIDTNQHIHLVMTHIKACFTREWTQFDMVCMYAAIITLMILSFILVIQVVKFIIKARKNEPLDSITIYITPSRIKNNFDENDSCTDNCMTKLFKILTKFNFVHLNGFAVVLALVKYSLIITLGVGILPTILWLCRSTFIELHIPVPQILVKLNSLTANAVTFEEDPLDLAQAVTTTQTTKGDIYTIHIITFFSTIFLLIFFILWATYQFAQFVIAYDSISALIIPTTIKIRSKLKEFTSTISKEKSTWYKFILTVCVTLGVLHGHFSNSYIDSEASVMHFLCTCLGAWTIFSLYHSYMYYYVTLYDDVDNEQDTNTILQHQQNNDTDSNDEQESLLPRRSTRGSTRQRDRSITRDVSSSELSSTTPSSSTTSLTEAATLPLQSKLKSKSSISVLKPKNFLYLCILAFICIAGMSFEVELAHTNSKLVFSVPYAEHTSLTSWYQSILYGHESPIPSSFINVLPEDIQKQFKQIHVNTNVDMEGATPDLLMKPKIVDAIIHRQDGDNHNHDEISEKRHQHDKEHQHNDNDNSSNKKSAIVVEPSQDALDKPDPIQMLKIALNMFSPDIALDGLFVRKDDRVLIYVKDIRTNDIIPYTAELSNLKEFDQNGQSIKMNILTTYFKTNHIPINEQQYYISETITAPLFGTAHDTRSHYSSFHVLIIFILFITGLIILQRFMMIKYKKSVTEQEDQSTSIPFHEKLPQSIRFYTTYLVPITAFYVSCYWIPSYIASIIQPIISTVISIFGVCSIGSTATILSHNDHIQFCGTSSSLRPLIVQFLRAYIPICVYLTGLIGVGLVIAFAIQLARIKNAPKSSHIQQYSFQLQQYYTPQQFLSLIFIVLFPTVCLVSGARSTVTYSLFLILLESTKRLLQTIFLIIPYNKQLVHFTNLIALFVFIIILMFHTTGHAYSFNDIHIAAGFVGVPGYIFGVSEILVFLNTFGSSIFGTFGTLQLGLFTTALYAQYRQQQKENENNNDNDDNEQTAKGRSKRNKHEEQQQPTNGTNTLVSIESQLDDNVKTNNFLSFSQLLPVSWILFWIAIRLLACTMNVHFQRRDLFVWPLYAPYWLLVAITSILTEALVIIYSLTLPNQVQID